MNTLPPNSSDQSVDPDGLEDARRAMRREALEYLAEADRLDAFYAAVTGDDPVAAMQQAVLS